MPSPSFATARAAQLLATILAAVAITFGASGCGVIGGGVSENSVSKRLQQEPDLQKVPADNRKNFADCLAKVAVKYGNKDDLKAYVDGKKPASDVRGMKGAAAEAEGRRCATILRK